MFDDDTNPKDRLIFLAALAERILPMLQGMQPKPMTERDNELALWDELVRFRSTLPYHTAPTTVDEAVAFANGVIEARRKAFPVPGAN